MAYTVQLVLRLSYAEACTISLTVLQACPVCSVCCRQILSAGSASSVTSYCASTLHARLQYISNLRCEEGLSLEDNHFYCTSRVCARSLDKGICTSVMASHAATTPYISFQPVRKT